MNAKQARLKVRDSVERVRKTDRALEDWRSDAQTDIDRVWYAAEFRRLEGVTQVVPPQEDYVFHDRLTHSMKVAQVAATLARKVLYEAGNNEALQAELRRHKINLGDWINPDHCYVAGLAHDIGHPPFGHAGEAAIQQIAKDSGLGDVVERSFEGNAQSTRIVASLSYRKAEEEGLNLTLRSLAAITKYPWKRGDNPSMISKLTKKWSFYPEETPILEKLEDRKFIAVESTDLDESDGQPRRRVDRVHRWPEAEIMDWSDDISYAVHDLEDFYRAGRIPLHRIASALNRAPHAMWTTEKSDWLTSKFEFAVDDQEVRAALQFARDKMVRQIGDDGNSLREVVPEAFSDIGIFLRPQMPTNRFDGTRTAHTSLQGFGSSAIVYLSNATSIDIFEVHGDVRVRFTVSERAKLVAEFFKALCHFYVIETSTLATMQSGQTREMQRLIEGLRAMSRLWVTGEVSERRLPARLRSLLADRFVRRKDDSEDEVESAILLAVIDFVCGLRDLQATILAARLFGDRSSLGMSGSWLDS